MKKRNLFFALLVIGGLSKINAQSYKHAIGASFGVNKNGSALLLSHNYFLDRHESVETSLLVSNSKYTYSDNKIPFKSTILSLGYSTNIYVDKANKLSLNGAGGLLLGYESVNNNIKVYSNEVLVLNDSKLIYGAYVGLDADYVINDKFSVFTKANQYWHANSDLGEATYFIGGGLRFYIN